MTNPLEPADTYVERAARVLRALERREARASSVRLDQSDADAACADVNGAIDQIEGLLPLIGVQTSRWDDQDARAAQLLLEEIARATGGGLRLLTNLARAHMTSAADALQALENAR